MAMAIGLDGMARAGRRVAPTIWKYKFNKKPTKWWAGQNDVPLKFDPKPFAAAF